MSKKLGCSYEKCMKNEKKNPIQLFEKRNKSKLFEKYDKCMKVEESRRVVSFIW